MAELQDQLAELIENLGTDWKNIWAKLGSGAYNTTAQNVRDAINELKASIENLDVVMPDASTTVKGVQENATDLEAAQLLAEDKTITPSNLAYLRGRAGGLAGLDGAGKVPASQLPAYVDDVIEAANFAALPVFGETGKIYVTLSDNNQWRWGGSSYIEIVASPGSTSEVPEGTNLYYTDARVNAVIDSRIGNTNTDLAALYAAAKA